ncbi:MAG: glycosyltransferase family 2 protein [Sumerlaeia bacterium]
MTAPPLRISIVIVCLNGAKRLAWPLESLRRCDPPPHEIIVADNGSTDGTANFVRENYPEVQVVRADRNLGFAGGNNLGIEAATGDVILLLNDDTEPEPDWLAPLAEAFDAHPRLGIAGCRLLYPDRTTVQHLGGVVHDNGLTDHVAWGDEARAQEAGGIVPVPYATGAALAIRRAVIEEVGLLDAGFWPIYFEEIDYCDRARRAGWEIAVVPRSTVIHHESQSTGRLSPGFLAKYHRNRMRYLLKNRDRRGLLRAARGEARWWLRHRPWDNLWPCLKAYGYTAVHCPGIWRDRRRDWSGQKG